MRQPNDVTGTGGPATEEEPGRRFRSTRVRTPRSQLAATSCGTGKPRLARSIAGAIAASRVIVPRSARISAHAFTAPGTDTYSTPSRPPSGKDRWPLAWRASSDAARADRPLPLKTRAFRSEADHNMANRSSPDPRHHRFDDSQGDGGSNGRIHRIAAQLKDPQSHLRRQRAAGGDCAAHRRHRRAPTHPSGR